MKILYLTANPGFVKEDATGNFPDKPNYAKLELSTELRRITDVLYESRAAGSVAFEVVPEVRRQDIVRYLGSREPNILHFSGHGEKKGIIVSDGYEDSGELASSEWLTGVLAGKNVDVLILNCCWSDEVAQELAKEVGLVIGVTDALANSDAAVFSEVFYDALQSGVNIKTAYQAASERVGGNQYQNHGAKDGIWERRFAALPGDGVELTPHQQLFGFQSNIAQTLSQVKWTVLRDIVMIVVAAAIAYCGYHLLAGSFRGFINGCDFCYAPDTGHGWRVALCNLFSGEKLAGWAKFEPVAVMTALAATPAGRLVGSFWAYFGAKVAKKALEVVAAQPEEKVKAELANHRITNMVASLTNFANNG